MDSLDSVSRRRAWRSAWCWGFLAGAVACTASSTDESLGTLEVRATTSGTNPDLDGYKVEVDAELPRALGPDGSTTFSAVPSGEHRVTLSGVASNCAAADSAVRHVVVEAGRTDTVAFSVDCAATLGSLQVRTVTTGEDLDPNGYTVLVDGATVATVADTGVTEVAVAAVRHQVALGGVTPNCAVTGENPRSVDVNTGASIPASFAVVCSQGLPAGPGGEISFITDRNPESAPWQLALANTDGTAVRMVVGTFGSAAWSPDGLSVAADEGSSILIGAVDENGVLGASQEIVAGDHGILGLAWAPGARVAYVEQDPEGDCEALSTVRPDGSDVQFLTFCDFYSGNPSWSPDGTTIGISSFSFDVFAQVILLYDASGTSDPRTLDTGSIEAITPSWSPDGARIAFASRGADGVEHEIYVVGAGGGQPVRLTRAPGDDGAPAWSPDGSRIAFVSHRDGNAEIYVMQADGSDPVRLTNNAATDTLPVWRP